MTLIAYIVSLILTVILGAAAQAPPPQRFDTLVRNDFFAGFGGNTARLDNAMDACERTLADNPNHAEALVWHGAGLAFRGGRAFRTGDMQTGGELWGRGLAEMERAVTLEPDNVGVRIPRGAMLLQATRFMAPDIARPLIETALGDYERTLALQTSSGSFAALGDHPKGELLFGLAEGYSRLGRPDKARTYFDQLIGDAPSSGHAPQAKAFLATGEPISVQGLGCVGCHK